jgi:hypothetical protein
VWFRRGTREERRARKVEKQRLKAERAHRKAALQDAAGEFSKKWFTYPDR